MTNIASEFNEKVQLAWYDIDFLEAVADGYPDGSIAPIYEALLTFDEIELAEKNAEFLHGRVDTQMLKQHLEKPLRKAMEHDDAKQKMPNLERLARYVLVG